MLIEIIGTGCAKCQTLEKNAKQAVDQSGGGHAVVKVSPNTPPSPPGAFSAPPHWPLTAI